MGENKTQAVATTGSAALAIPDYLKGLGHEGTEGLGKDDVQIPRLGIAQQMSPQMLEGDPKQIQGLKLGDMFNSLTGEILGRGPVEVVVIRRDQARGIEFAGDGSGIKDFNVPLDDPRMQFGPNGEKPVATRLYDYVLLLRPVEPSNPVASAISLSLKGSGLKTARQLNGLIRTRNAPVYTGVYKLSTAIQKNAKGTFAVLQVANAGWVTQEEFGLAKVAFDAFKDKAINFDVEDGEEPAVQEREPGCDDDI